MKHKVPLPALKPDVHNCFESRSPGDPLRSPAGLFVVLSAAGEDQVSSEGDSARRSAKKLLKARVDQVVVNKWALQI